MAHTPTPWKIDESGDIVTEEGGLVATPYDGTLLLWTDFGVADANASLIMEAVNTHESLTRQRDELREALTLCNRVFGRINLGTLPPDVASDVWDAQVKLRTALANSKP